MAWARAAEATSVVICVGATQPDTQGRQHVPTLPMKRWLPVTHPAWLQATREAQVSLSYPWTGIR